MDLEVPIYDCDAVFKKDNKILVITRNRAIRIYDLKKQESQEFKIWYNDSNLNAIRTGITFLGSYY